MNTNLPSQDSISQIESDCPSTRAKSKNNTRQSFRTFSIVGMGGKSSRVRILQELSIKVVILLQFGRSFKSDKTKFVPLLSTSFWDEVSRTSILEGRSHVQVVAS
jgi:hypothetical protein